MSKRIEKISDSPCSKCGYIVECSEKIRRIHVLCEIRDAVFGNADFDYHNCGIWIALNAKEMVEVDE